MTGAVSSNCARCSARACRWPTETASRRLHFRRSAAAGCDTNPPTSSTALSKPLNAPAPTSRCAPHTHTQTHTRTHPYNGPLSGTTRVGRYQKGKTKLDFTEARDGEWQWHQLGHMQVCTSLQADNHTSTPPLSFLQAGCPSCRPTNSVKELKVSHNLS